MKTVEYLIFSSSTENKQLNWLQKPVQMLQNSDLRHAGSCSHWRKCTANCDDYVEKQFCS